MTRRTRPYAYFDEDSYSPLQPNSMEKPRERPKTAWPVNLTDPRNEIINISVEDVPQGRK